MDISDWTNLRKYKEVGSNDGKFCKVKMFRQTESTAWKIRVSDQVIYIGSSFHGTISYEQMQFLNKVCATVKKTKQNKNIISKGICTANVSQREMGITSSGITAQQ